MTQTSTLTFDELTQAVSGKAAAFRRVVELQPAGGPGAKVFPPTYDGGKYATEKRRINGESVDCVLLDSVQSQANRMEAALQEALDAKHISIPVISVDFTETNASWVGKITSLQAPHRIADAILRDSHIDNTPFRQTQIGKLLDKVSVHEATALFQYCPTALVFGMWDSTGPRGGLGTKFARAVVSEIIGINAQPGQRTSSRIDPTQITAQGITVYKASDTEWTLDAELALKDDKGNPIKVGKSKKQGKPSAINHSNVKPAFVFQKDDVTERNILDKDGNPIPIGGFTIDYAQQITVISLPTLRRLRFPIEGKIGSDISGRVVLTALALYAATLDIEKGYNLRSQCDLYAAEVPVWELLGAPGAETKQFALTSSEVVALLQKAVEEAEKVGLKWHTDEVILTPRADLVSMVVQSHLAGGAIEDGGEG
jgi:CRISPR-associated protein Csb1